MVEKVLYARTEPGAIVGRFGGSAKIRTSSGRSPWRRHPSKVSAARRKSARRWVGNLNPGYSYLCSNDPRVHFGLGSADRVDSIQVRWPDGDGAEEIFSGGAADRVVVLRRGEGKMAAE